MPRKIIVSVPVDPEQFSKLQSLSKRTRIPKTVYIREGIDLVLREQFEKEQLELFKAKAPERQSTA